MLIKWDDLMPGDVVKLSKETKEKYKNDSWFYNWNKGELVIETISNYLDYIDVSVIMANGKTSSITIHKELGTAFIGDNFPFFEIVNLTEDENETTQ